MFPLRSHLTLVASIGCASSAAPMCCGHTQRLRQSCPVPAESGTEQGTQAQPRAGWRHPAPISAGSAHRRRRSPCAVLQAAAAQRRASCSRYYAPLAGANGQDQTDNRAPNQPIASVLGFPQVFHRVNVGGIAGNCAWRYACKLLTVRTIGECRRESRGVGAGMEATTHPHSLAREGPQKYRFDACNFL